MPAATPLQPHRVALLGFGDFDRSALAGYLRLTQRREPSYLHVLGIDDAQLVIADLDHPEALELLQRLGRVGDAVFVGGQGPADAAGWIRRPISQNQVIRELDAALRGREPPDAMRQRPLPLAPPPEPPFGSTGTALRSLGEVLVAASSGRRADDLDGPTSTRRLAEAAAERRRRAAAALAAADLRPSVLPRALLVDDSEIALHFLRRQLAAYALSVDCARHSGQALEMMGQRGYGIVFLDLDLGEHSRMDGLTLCQHIRRQMVHPGGRAPVVVISSAFNDPVDRVRGTLAGAEDHLGKPLDTVALEQFMLRLGFAAREHSLPAAPLGVALPPRHPDGNRDRW